MNKTVKFGSRTGTVAAPKSKSQLHRLIICAALSDKVTKINCGTLSDDIAATVDAVNTLFADIKKEDGTLLVTPNRTKSDSGEVLCGDSGSTLRFLLPVCAALGKTVRFKLSKGLAARPIKPLCDELNRHGATVKAEGNTLFLSGKLIGGEYTALADISSQFLSGLLLGLPLLEQDSTVKINGKINSKPYVDLTVQTLKNFGVSVSFKDGTFFIKGNQKFTSYGVSVNGDWSSAAFFLCLGALSNKGVTVTGLCTDCSVGDGKITEILKDFGAVVKKGESFVTVQKNMLRAVTVDASDIPDLVPAISVLASVSKGESVIKNVDRLKFKESDRVNAVCSLINGLGGSAYYKDGNIVITGKSALKGGAQNCFGDHRIAMSAAIAAACTSGDVTVLSAECVNKSYPDFWKDLESLEV